jgi:hypothetical protein
VALGEGRNSEPASLPVRRSGPYHVEQQAAERASPAISEEGGQVVEIAGRLPSGRCGEKNKNNVSLSGSTPTGQSDSLIKNRTHKI